MRTPLLLLNALFIAVDVYFIGYRYGPQWLALLAANILAFAVVWVTPPHQ